MNPSVVMVIEGEKNVRTGPYKSPTHLEKIDYEFECICSVNQWRKKGGVYKDIPIYVVCPSKNTPRLKTIETLKNLGVVYVGEVHPLTEGFNNGFHNKPVGCKMIEDMFSPEQLIFHDTDAFVMSSPADSVFTVPDGFDIKVCVYQDKEEMTHDVVTSSRNGEHMWLETMSGFIIPKPNYKFYNLWYDHWLDEYTNEHRIEDITERCFIEEEIISYMHYDKIIRIYPLYNFYMNHIMNDDINNIEPVPHFVHSHLFKKKFAPYLKNILKNLHGIDI